MSLVKIRVNTLCPRLLRTSTTSTSLTLNSLEKELVGNLSQLRGRDNESRRMIPMSLIFSFMSNLFCLFVLRKRLLILWLVYTLRSRKVGRILALMLLKPYSFWRP